MKAENVFSWRWKGACLALVVAGVACGEWLKLPPGAAEDSAALHVGGENERGDAGKNATAPSRHHGKAEDAKVRLAALAQEPLPEMSEDGVIALAGLLDLTREESVNLINGVLNQTLRDRLWQAALRSQADKLPLEALVAFGARVHSGNRAYVNEAIFDRIRHDGGATDWQAPGMVELRRAYVEDCSTRSGSLAETLAMLPPGDTASRQSAIVLRSEKHATLAELRDLMAMQPEQGADDRRTLTFAVRTWENLPASDRGEFLAEIDKLPAAERNNILARCASGFRSDSPHDTEGMVALMAEATSLATQKEIASRLVDLPEERQNIWKWLAAIDQSPQAAKLGKVRSYLEDIEAKQKK